MGGRFSIFRRNRKKEFSFAEAKKELEKLQNESQDLQKKRETAVKSRRTVVWSLILFCVFAEIIWCLLLYILYATSSLQFLHNQTSSTTTIQIICALFAPLFVIPILCVLLKGAANMYYQRKVNKLSIKLATLKDNQKKRIEDIKAEINLERLKEMCETVERFARQLNDDTTTTDYTNIAGQRTPTKTPQANRRPPKQPSTPIQNQQQPVIPQTPQQQIQQQQYVNTPLPTPQQLNNIGHDISNMNNINNMPATPMPVVQQTPHKYYMPVPKTPARAPVMPMPSDAPAEPPKKKGWFDWVVDYAVGDGPEYSSALICKNCGQLNGMIPTSEAENYEFRCKFCSAPNKMSKGQVTLVASPAPSTSSKTEVSPSSSTSSSPKVDEHNHDENPEKIIEVAAEKTQAADLEDKKTK